MEEREEACELLQGFELLVLLALIHLPRCGGAHTLASRLSRVT